MLVFQKAMWKSSVKIVVAISFLLLLAVPVGFYRSGRRGALLEAAWVVLLFTLTAWGGRRWLKVFNIESLPSSLDARVLTGLAFTIVFLLSGEVQHLLHYTSYGMILGGFQTSVLIGLFGEPVGGWWFTKPGFWRKPEYLVATVILGVSCMGLFALSWADLHWWGLLMVPGVLLGTELGVFIGSSVRPWALALRDVWETGRRMGPPIGGFALGYLVIAIIFAGLFAAVWRADSTAFK